MPNDLKLFGTAAYPLHPSGMRTLVTCPWRVVMEFLSSPDDESGKAADTGSAMHRAAAAMHKGSTVAESLGIMQAEIVKYPLADLTDAAHMFLKYSEDARNRSAKVLFVEETIKFSIDPAAEDPTQERIEVIGTVDQVREDHGRYRVWDIKTSKRDPNEVLLESTFQMAAYCIGASVKLGKLVEPGGLIMPRQYRADIHNSPVFWHYNFKVEDIGQLLYSVRRAVAEVRSGKFYHVPNLDCKWCHQKTPDVCFPKLIQLQRLSNVA